MFHTAARALRTSALSTLLTVLSALAAPSHPTHAESPYPDPPKALEQQAPRHRNALTAQDLRFVGALSTTSIEEQAKRYLGAGRGRQLAASTRTVRRFLRDPALRAFKTFDDDWLVGVRSERPEGPHLFESLRELIQCKVMIVRNLYFRGTPLSRQAVLQEYRRILDARARHSHLSLFARRSVVLAASYHEVRGYHGSVFGQRSTQNRLRRLAAAFTFVQPGSPSQSAAASRSILRRRLAEPEPVTFFFEGHGRQRALKLGGAFGVQELADLLALGDDSSSRILIASSCQGHGYARLVLEKLNRHHPNRSLPVTVVPEEYGQNLTVEVFQDLFKSSELGLSHGDTTLGRLMKQARYTTSVYVPDEQNRPMQIL